MTPIERFRLRLERRAAALAPDMRAELLRAFQQIRQQILEPELVRLIESGQLDRLLDPATIDQSLTALRQAIRDSVETSGRLALRDLPAKAALVAFDVLSPRVIEAIRGLDTRVLQGLRDDIRESVRAYVENGLRDGVNPRTIARNLRDVVGLAPNQVRAIANFRQMLEEGDREALTRLLRDRRFDRTIAKAFDGEGLTEAQVDRMVEAYRKRMEAFHAETIARTAANDAQKLGHHLTWQQAVESGNIDGTTLTKRWSGTLDDRERPSHLAMEGETVPWNQPYSNGQMQPGDNEYNCRCVSVYSTLAKPKASAGAFGLSPDQLRVGGRLRVA